MATIKRKVAGNWVTVSDTDLFVPLAGGTMTGFLVLSGAPTSDLHAATKKYVDDFRVSAAFSVVGRKQNSSGVVADISAGVTNRVFARKGSEDLGFVTLTKAMIDSTSMQMNTNVVSLSGTPRTATVNYPTTFSSSSRVVAVNGDVAANHAILAIGNTGSSSFDIRDLGSGTAGSIRVNWFAWAQ